MVTLLEECEESLINLREENSQVKAQIQNYE